ncbi:hypothetical protein, partial [Priestia aryabhattai]|uniref:hypothetical protein n=1 Tax=Priestia aryabhattai TaxID=412384 RepID=UPI002E22CDFD|nr:hypothetical protein [Priestia aryabhattai]
TIMLEKVTDASSNSGSSGGARLNAMSTYLKVMLEHPFGAGYDNLTKALMSSTYESNVAGAGLMGLFAALGIIPSIFILYLITHPFFVNKNSKWIECIAFLSVYFNTGLAQSYAFYPALLIIPVLFYLDNRLILYENNKLR